MSRRFFDGSENIRPRSKSEILIPTRPSSSIYPARNRPVLPAANRDVRPRLLKQRFNAYSLPVSTSSPRLGSQLPDLTPKELIDYFTELNDLRVASGLRVFPDEYRYIYPLALLQPSEISSLQAHILHPSIHVHWRKWLDEIKDLISEWERAVCILGKEVQEYLELPEGKKSTYKRIDDLNSSTTQGVNQFIELHLDRAVQIVKAPRRNSGQSFDSKFLELGAELESWKAKYANLHEERRKWTRMKLGYKY